MIITRNVCERSWQIIPSIFNELRNHVCDSFANQAFDLSVGNLQRLRVLLINFLSKFLVFAFDREAYWNVVIT